MVPTHFVCLIALVSITSSVIITGERLTKELGTIFKRRVESIIAENYNASKAKEWHAQLKPGGNWRDIDYTTGCSARRAEWPAEEHLLRIITMASVWSRDPRNNKDLLAKISLAMNWWNDKDFKQEDCITAGGNESQNCPCGTEGMWNTNWWYQTIEIPALFGQACLLLKSHLTKTQIRNCTNQMSRAYARIDGDPHRIGPMRGSNLLEVATIAVSLGLFTENPGLVQDAVLRFYKEAQYTSGFADGIRVDGSFMQHTGQVYNGNYGKAFMKTMLKIFRETQGTSLAPPRSVQRNFLALLNASEWFIYSKVNRPGSCQLAWQYSTIGRMISSRLKDWHGIDMDLNEILNGTRKLFNAPAFKEIVTRLFNCSNVNPGGLIGTRYFHTSDHLVHRGPNYIVTLKMFSNRTTNSECYNDQNPSGFHLSDGSIFIYRTGHEYTDVFGAWDWDLIPGTTVDYGGTPKSCKRVEKVGKESYVGGLALENSGMAVMNYTNPLNGSLHWLKTFSFFPYSYVVQFVGEVRTNASARASVVTTLDQRHLSGPVFIDGQLMRNKFTSRLAQRVWHDYVGYEFKYPVNLTVDTRPTVSNWSAIGISKGNETHSLFTAFFKHSREQKYRHDDYYSYIVHLGVDQTDFERGTHNEVGILPRRCFKKPKSTAKAKGAYYRAPAGMGQVRIFSLAFLTKGEYHTGLEDIVKVETSGPIVLIFYRKANNLGWRVAVADPGQTLAAILIRVSLAEMAVPIKLHVNLPSGLWAGSTIVVEF